MWLKSHSQVSNNVSHLLLLTVVDPTRKSRCLYDNVWNNVKKKIAANTNLSEKDLS